MGREHMRNLALVEGCDLVAIADPDAGSREAAARLAGELAQDIRCYQEPIALLDNETIDAVVIASPNHTHFDVIQPIMQSEVAILLEKPMCTTVEHASSLLEMQSAYSPLFWVGMEYRYMPPVARFIERVRAGDTGPVNMLCIREHRFPFLPKIGDWNRFSRNTGGTLVEKCCHFFDLMRYMLNDEPVKIYASGGQDVNHLDERYNGETPDILDNAFVTIDFAGGARAVLDLCMFAEGSEQQEDIYALGHLGKLEVQIPAANVTWSPRDGSGPVVEAVDTPADAMAAGHHHGATYFQLRDFHAALVQGGPALVSASDGYKAVVMGAAAHESIETGHPVMLSFKD